MKTTEILNTMDEALMVEKLWKEKRSAIYQHVEQQRKALEQQLKDLEKTNDVYEIFVTENKDKLKLVDKACEKIMAFFKTVDDDSVKKTISQFERGIITQLELIHELKKMTFEVSFDAETKSYAETNW
jgi:hypothetical protein